MSQRIGIPVSLPFSAVLDESWQLFFIFDVQITVLYSKRILFLRGFFLAKNEVPGSGNEID
jgi:hypothetical protein